MQFWNKLHIIIISSKKHWERPGALILPQAHRADSPISKFEKTAAYYW